MLELHGVIEMRKYKWQMVSMILIIICMVLLLLNKPNEIFLWLGVIIIIVAVVEMLRLTTLTKEMPATIEIIG
jgi:membrane protein implicated in regulation of membrane protease activity